MEGKSACEGLCANAHQQTIALKAKLSSKALTMNNFFSPKYISLHDFDK